jgi:WD40 repeat protein/serine/threonine protein kinase
MRELDQRAKEIFEAALKMPPRERAAYLDQACGGDAQLRQRIVEALFKAQEDAAATAQASPSPSPEKTIVVAFTAEAPGEKPGDWIGHYKLLDQRGEGGMGTVWVAEQSEPVRRKAALKIIKLGMDTRQVIARFEAERQALALMDHPNIAKVFDAGATEKGRPYFVMEFVPGEPITTYCDRQNLPTRERLDLFVQVCRAIQHAHQKGIIHRDIKPSNILVALQDGVPMPKVIDFGIAKATAGQQLTDKTLYTALEQFVGTPAYMSPEQAEMAGVDIDTRSDIYSLGVMLYELLTSKVPFDPKRLVQAGLDEIRRIIREEEPARPSTRINTLDAAEQTTVAKRRQSEPPKLIHQVRGDLDWIVMKCLAKDRTRRYETANGLAMDLERHLNDEPIVARPPGALYRFRKMARRHKLAFAAATAVTLALGLGIIGSTWQAVRARRAEREQGRLYQEAEQARRQAEANERRAQSEAQRAERAVADVKGALSASDFFQATRLIAEDDCSDALAYLARSLTANPTNAAALTRLTTLLTYHSWPLPAVGAMKHNDIVLLAQFSLDGKRIVTTSSDGARVWDAQSGQLLTDPIENSRWVRSAQFDSDGKRIVTASSGGARVWDAQSGQLLTEPIKHNGGVELAEFSPDGKRILTASFAIARVWDVQTGQPLTEPLKHGHLVHSAQFSPDGKRIVTASDDNTARVWDSQTGQLLTEPLKHSGWVNSAQFGPDGKRIATASNDHTARVWDGQTGRLLIEPMKHNGAVFSAQFSPNGQRVVTASADETARVWGVLSSEALTEPMKHNGEVRSAQFSPDGKRILTASYDHTARVWDAQNGQALTEPLKYNIYVPSVYMGGGLAFSAQFSPDGKWIVTTYYEAALVWDAQTGQLLTEPLKHSGWVNSAQFSPDGKRIVTASRDNTARVMDAQSDQPLNELMKHNKYESSARVWDAQSGHPLTEPMKHSGDVRSAQFSPDGKRIVTASDDHTARVWDAQSGHPLTEPMKHSEDVRSAQFSPDGKRIVTASWDSTARVWDAQSGQPLTEPMKHNGHVTSAQFSPDGKRIVTVSDDYTARVWDAQSGHPLTAPMKHSGDVRSAQFSPDGKRIVTVSDTARVWDAQSGQPLTEPMKHNGTVYSAQFSPDGRRIVTADGGAARVWDIGPSGAGFPDWLLTLAEAVAGGRLNQQGVLEATGEDLATVIGRIRQQLEQVPVNDNWVVWGRWFLADRATRTISPFSKVTVPEYIKNRIKENTVESLVEAEQLTYGNADLLERVSTARSKLEETGERSATAEKKE